MEKLRSVHVTRYVTPLREGGSMPAIAEADDGFLYVVKFRGAGQGPKALLAELIGSEIASLLGFRVPELVFANLDEAFGRTEADEEIQDLLKFSVGLNLGLHYLSGSITFDPAVNELNEQISSEIVWLDSLLMNMDRTSRNTNMLIWNKELWLIDHGASLYFHHSWQNLKEQAEKPFGLIKDHVLLAQASQLREVDSRFRSTLTTDKLEGIISELPEEWLGNENPYASADEHRTMYLDYFNNRLKKSEIFVNEAINARKKSI